MSRLIAAAPAATPSPTSTSTWRSTCSASPPSSTASRDGWRAAPPLPPMPTEWRRASKASPSWPGRRRSRPAQKSADGGRVRPYRFGIEGGEMAGGWAKEAARGLRRIGRLRLVATLAMLVLALLGARYSWGLPFAADAERGLYDLRFDWAAQRRTVAQDPRIVLIVYNDQT